MPRKPHIGLVHYTYPPVIGGVENILKLQADFFADYGYNTSVFVGKGSSEGKRFNFHLIPEFQSLGIIDPDTKTEMLTKPQYPQKIFDLSESIYNKIIHLFKTVDILIVHNVLTLTLNPALNLAILKYHKNFPNKKIISWIHDSQLDDGENETVKIHYVNSALSDLIYNPQDGIHYVAISNFLKKTLVSLLHFVPEKITVVPNGIEVDKFLDLHPLTQKILSTRENFGPVIFAPTKIMKHKRIDLTIQVFYKLLEIKKNAILIISANGFPHSLDMSYSQTMRSLVTVLGLNKRIIFLQDEMNKNNVTEGGYEIVKDFYRLSDLVLFLSIRENFGLPVLEAALAKTPIICSDLEIYKEINTDYLFTLKKEEVNPTKIALFLKEILDASASAKAFSQIKKSFDYKTIFVEKIIPLVESLST